MGYQMFTNQTGYNNTIYDKGKYGAGIGDGKNGFFGGNQVGDLLSGTLLQGGKEPILDLNGIQIKTHASEELEKAKPGDTVYLKIQGVNKNQVSLKLVGIQSQDTEIVEDLGMVTNAQVLQTARQYGDMIQDNLGGVSSQEENKENQKEIIRNLTADEIAKLRQMQVDVSNAEWSDLMGMVITLRNNDHIEEINEQIGDIVKETIGELRESITGGDDKFKGTDEIGTDGDVEEKKDTEPQQMARLNEEGYVVNVPKKREASSSNAVMPGEKPEDGVIYGDSKIISKEQFIYLVKNGLDLTIDNLELAKNSVNEESPFMERPLNNKIWDDIYPQVTGIIEATGMAVTDENLDAAKFMLTHELPITTDSLRLYRAVESINQRGISVSALEGNIREQISMGNSPKQARISGSSLQDKANQLMDKVKGITERAVDYTVGKGKPLTLAYLYNYSVRSIDVRRMRGPVTAGADGASLSLSGVGQDGTNPETALPLSTNPSAVAARRQLEEIRLSMTLDAAIRLVGKDINIDAKPLSKIVEELRNQENQYYDEMISKRELHDIPEGVDLLKETLKETEALKKMPEYVLGEVAKRPMITLGELYESGRNLKYKVAGDAYETMMTKPRRDMGDSITEAFQNVEDILRELDLDRNDENKRAVRILAYNQMDLTEKNIVTVKTADAKVNQMFETLTPQIVLNMIRENKNPLNMTIDGMNEEIMSQRELRGVTDEQKFSEFLYRMDRNNEITEEERQSFIGIYRLLDKVEKSHGKDIGAVIRNGQEVTLQNLFSADKSRKVQGMDVKVDETFGERVDVTSNEKSILNQVQTAYNQTLAGNILRHITPEALKNFSDMDYYNLTLEELNHLVNVGDAKTDTLQFTEPLREELQLATEYKDEVATMLDANHMPLTATNIIAAHEVMHGEDGIYGMIGNIKRNLSREARDTITELEDKMLESIESREDVIYGMENIRSRICEKTHEKEEDGTITAMDIQALKYLNAGMPIAMRTVEEDIFRVPVVVNGDVSIMKVSIVQDKDHAGEIRVSVPTKAYGELDAFVYVSDNRIEGYITTQDEEGQNVLEQGELTIRSVLAKAGMEVRDLRLDGTKPVQYGFSENHDVSETSKLYRISKHLLTAIKLTGVLTDN